MNKILNSELCFGCRSCELSCPKRCIDMVYNNEGFLYPHIDKNSCINCGKCIRVCPIYNETPKSLAKICLAFSRNDEEINNSASGGAASFFSKHFIGENRYVCGSIYNEKNEVIHYITNKSEDLTKFNSSKYVQSDTLDTYKRVKELLLSGSHVLFFGTPCQIHGLKSFLKNDFEKLITVDLICHGVPSPKLFEAYIKWLEEKEKSTITDYNFRYKNKYGRGLYYYYYCKDTKKRRSGELFFDPYGNDFLQCKNYRESCYRCPYASIYKRPGDITIGDFWASLNTRKDLYNKHGVSSIIVNNKKGEDFIKSLGDVFRAKEVTIEDSLTSQCNLSSPTIRPDSRDLYYKDFSLDYFFKKTYRYSFSSKIKHKIPIKLKNMIKRALLKTQTFNIKKN